MVVTMSPLVSGSIHATGVTNADTYPFVNGGNVGVNNAEAALMMLAASGPPKKITSKAGSFQAGSAKSVTLMFDSTKNGAVEQVMAPPLTPLNAMIAVDQPIGTVKDVKAATWQAGRHDRLAGMAGWSEEKRLQRSQQWSQQSTLAQSSKTVLAGRAKYIKPRICPAFPNGFASTAQTDFRTGTPLQRALSAPCLPDGTSRTSTPKPDPRNPMAPRQTGWIGWTPADGPSRRYAPFHTTFHQADAAAFRAPINSTEHVDRALGATLTRGPGTPKRPHSKSAAGVVQDDINPSIPFCGFPTLAFLRGF